MMDKGAEIGNKNYFLKKTTHDDKGWENEKRAA